MSKAGEFEIDVWRGGFPVWCVLQRHGIELCRFSSDELSDLEYAARKAQEEADHQKGKP